MDEIKKLLNIGENNEIEFKECKEKLPKSIWSTYSAFCNTNGGIIVLGIKENNKKFIISGIENPQTILKSFWDTINNPQKISNNILYDTDVQIKEIENKKIIIISIPKAIRQNKPIYINNNPITGTYKRNYEGDYLCTQKEVTDMLVEASNTSKDSMVIENYTFEDLNMQTIKDYRNRYKNIAEVGNLWNNLSDIDFLKTIGAIDKKTNNLTLAGLLIFGNESDITRVLPNYQLDYKELLDIDLAKDERWSNRIVSWNGMWSGNLYDFYTLVIRRLIVDLEVPFKLDNEMYRIDTTPIHKAVREALVNSIVHTDYILSGIISVEKGLNYFKFENPR